MKFFLLHSVVLGTLFAADAPKAVEPPRMTPTQIETLNHIAQVADLEKQLATAKATIHQLEQLHVVERACWDNGIPPDKCKPQPDGSLIEPEKTDLPKK